MAKKKDDSKQKRDAKAAPGPKVRREYLIAAAAVIVIVVLALLYIHFNGTSDNPARDSAQDAYDQKVVAVNEQIDVVNNFSAEWQTTIAVPLLKGYLDDYRSNLTTLSGMVNDTLQAGDVLKGYLTNGSSDYAAVANNEQMLQENLALYVSDYNSHASSYNGAVNGSISAQYGNATLF